MLWFSSVLFFNLTFHHGNLEMKGLNKATLAFCNRYQTNLDKSSLVILILLLAKSLRFKKGLNVNYLIDSDHFERLRMINSPLILFLFTNKYLF